jgi:hypothetical protein
MGSSPNVWGRGWLKSDYLLDDEGKPVVSGSELDSYGPRPQLKARPDPSSSPSSTAPARRGPRRGLGEVDQEGFWKRDWEEWVQGGERCWDWAGVEGEWMRCVCWMDYRGLLCECFFFIHLFVLLLFCVSFCTRSGQTFEVRLGCGLAMWSLLLCFISFSYLVVAAPWHCPSIWIPRTLRASFCLLYFYFFMIRTSLPLLSFLVLLLAKITDHFFSFRFSDFLKTSSS